MWGRGGGTVDANARDAGTPAPPVRVSGRGLVDVDGIGEIVGTRQDASRRRIVTTRGAVALRRRVDLHGRPVRHAHRSSTRRLRMRGVLRGVWGLRIRRHGGVWHCRLGDGVVGRIESLRGRGGCVAVHAGLHRGRGGERHRVHAVDIHLTGVMAVQCVGHGVPPGIVARVVVIQLVLRIAQVVGRVGIMVIERCAEILARDQFVPGFDVGQPLILRGRFELAVEHVVDGVVRHEVVMHALHVHAHGLLHQAFVLEAVGIDQRSDQRAFAFAAFAHAAVRSAARGGRRRWGGIAALPWVRFAGAGGPLAPLRRAFLLARREGLGQFSIDEEVAQDPTRAPRHAISPSLDARRVLFVDEDAAAADEGAAFPIVRSPRHMARGAVEAGFEQHQCIPRGGDVPGPGWVQRRVHHDVQVSSSTSDDLALGNDGTFRVLGGVGCGSPGGGKRVPGQRCTGRNAGRKTSDSRSVALSVAVSRVESSRVESSLATGTLQESTVRHRMNG